MRNLCNLLIICVIVNIFLFSQCSAEYSLATKEEEHILFSTAREVNLGRSLAQAVEKELAVCKDAKIQERIQQIGQQLVEVCDRKDITYSFVNNNSFEYFDYGGREEYKTIICGS